MIRLPLAPLVAITFLGQCVSSIAQAPPAPFDMSPERPASPEPVPRMPRPNRTESQPASPPDVSPAKPPAEDRIDPQRETEAPTSQQQPGLPPSPPPDTEVPEAVARRYFIPSESLALTGEHSRNAWSLYLTAEQAEAAQSMSLAYRNAIVVAPEASTLSLSINNRRIGDEQIRSPNGLRTVEWRIPPGLLRPGNNDLQLAAEQRHRTDCDIRSTYDLWTEVDSGGSFITFAPSLRSGSSPAEAVRSLAADAEGHTTFQLIVPAIGSTEQLAPLLRLSQGLAVMNGMPNPQFTFEQQMPQNQHAGQLTVAVGTAAELSEVVPSLPPGAETGPAIALTQTSDGGGPLVVVTGPTWSAVTSAIDSFVAPVSRSPALRRDSMSSERWTGRTAPFVFGGETFTFAQLGIPTTEFSGRRFRTGFDIAVPSDFYAGAYGETMLLLDAAYGGSVAAGSHIDVYVNGNIASTTPIYEDGGGILRQAPIRVTMRHLTAGINRIELEAVLPSDADAACTPASEASNDPRFALFETSALYVPPYARIGQTPNLAALAGTGAPYSRQQEPTALYMDRIDAAMLSAAATFFGKMAQVSGAPLALEPVSAANAVGGRNAIYIGAAGQLPVNVLTQLNLDPDLAATWQLSDAEREVSGSQSLTLEDWRSRLQGGFIEKNLALLRDWLRAKLDVSENALRFLPSGEPTYKPADDEDLLLAQGPGPSGGIWTVLTAPNAQELKLATSELARQSVWQQVEGRIFSYSRATDEATVQEARKLSFLPTIDPSVSNYRLIAANWLSSNLLSYALLLVVASCLLGITTATLLHWIGRRR